MKEIVSWLISIEQTAHDFYRNSSVFFRNDPQFSTLLKQLSDDEKWHACVMHRADEFLKNNPGQASFISLDAATKEKVEKPLREHKEMLIKGGLTKESTLGCIVETEFSEWNDIFVYVVTTMKNFSTESQHVASKINQHRREIERYVQSVPEGSKYGGNLKGLRPVWEEKILIVEDSEPIAELLEAVLAEKGGIERADNGEAGLRKVNSQYFDVIISDVNMPFMSGPEFYAQAALKDPGIGRRFIFFASAPSEENIEFFAKNNLRYLTKPASIEDIKKAVDDTIQKTYRLNDGL